MVRVEDISIKLGNFELEEVSFEVKDGEYFVLLGESGIGKSVVLEIICGLLKPNSGKIYVDDNDVTNVSIQKREVGLVYQDQALFPHMSVRSNIKYPMKYKMSRIDVDKRIHELAEQTGIEHLLDRGTINLSLGEAQRTALARTLARSPKVLLLDEPLASLDIQAKAAFRALLRKVNSDGMTVIHVTHDYEESIALADRIGVLEKKRLAQVGTPDDIFHSPKTEFIANFVGIKNFFKGYIEANNDDLALFKTDGLEFDIASDLNNIHGNAIIRSEDITISNSEPVSSARNHFKGKVIDLEPARLGTEIVLDIGVKVMALVTKQSVETLEIEPGKEFWVNFKASAVRFVADE